MRRLAPARAGFAVGLVFALYHFTWATLVALGWAKPLLDLVLKLHFIQLQYELEPFSPVTGAALVGVTFVVGALFGIAFALIWNWLGEHAAAAAATPPGETASAR